MLEEAKTPFLMRLQHFRAQSFVAGQLASSPLLMRALPKPKLKKYCLYKERWWLDLVVRMDRVPPSPLPCGPKLFPPTIPSIGEPTAHNTLQRPLARPVLWILDSTPKTPCVQIQPRGMTTASHADPGTILRLLNSAMETEPEACCSQL